jgi:hypothetical protein
LVLGTDPKYNDLNFARKAKYFFRSAYDSTQSNKHWADATKSYIEYEGTKYMLSTAFTDCFAQVADTAMPETNSTTIKVIAVTTTGYKKFTVEYSYPDGMQIAKNGGTIDVIVTVTVKEPVTSATSATFGIELTATSVDP